MFQLTKPLSPKVTVKLILSSLLAAAALCIAVSAQQTADLPQLGSEATLRVTTKLVVLDVVVTDAKGHIVRNLKRDDFEVFEDKVPQRIRALEEVGGAADAPPPAHAIHSTAELDRWAPGSPVSIIVLDEITSTFTDEAFTRISLKRYLSAQGDTLNQPIMLVAVDMSHFNVLRDYTTSKKEILAALDHHFAANPWRAQSGSFGSEQFNAAFVSLMEVAQATAGHPGHKNMIWIGRGFPPIDPTGMLPDDAATLHRLIESCTNMLRDSRITLYTVDPAGLSATPPPETADGFLTSDPFGGQVDFNTMAETTGGKAFYGRNDVDNLIGLSVTSGAHFYTVSYAPANPLDATAKAFRNITVRLKDRSLIATTRAGYYSSAPPAPLDTLSARADDASKTKNQMAFDISVASESNMVYDGVPFAIERSSSRPDEFEIHIKPQDIAWEPTAESKLKADVTLLVESYDKRDKQIKRFVRALHLESNPQLPGTEALPLPLDLPVVISTDAPAARIRLVVRMNATGKIGAQNYDLAGQKKGTTGASPK